MLKPQFVFLRRYYRCGPMLRIISAPAKAQPTPSTRKSSEKFRSSAGIAGSEGLPPGTARSAGNTPSLMSYPSIDVCRHAPGLRTGLRSPTQKASGTELPSFRPRMARFLSAAIAAAGVSDVRSDWLGCVVTMFKPGGLRTLGIVSSKEASTRSLGDHCERWTVAVVMDLVYYRPSPVTG